MVAWFVILVATLGLAAAAGGSTADNFEVPGAESQRAFDLLEKRFPARVGDSFQIVLASDRGFADPGVEAEVARVLERFAEPRSRRFDPRTL